MFWQVWSNIYWNILGMLPVKIFETSHTKSCRNFSAKFLEIFRSRSQALQPIFSQPYRNIFQKITRNCCLNIPTIITRMVSETFLKYFMNALQGGHEYFTKYFVKFLKYLLTYFTRAAWLQKILQNVLGKVSRSIRHLVWNFFNQYFYKLAEVFFVKL